MPHTSRKNKNRPPKRVQITDEDGWTTVTTTNGPRKLPSHITNRIILNPENQVITPDPGVTLDKLKQQYALKETQWQQSEAYQALNKLIKESVCKVVDVDNLIIFGSGSTCGGWRRHDVALTQLAVLKSIASTLEAETGSTPPMFAQDPAYNDLDRELLSSLGYKTVTNPEGFALITGKSLVYTPGAELFVEMGVLELFPAVLLTGKLDWYWRNDKGVARTNRIVSFAQQELLEKRIAAGMEKDEDLDRDEEVYGYGIEDRDQVCHEARCRIVEAFNGAKNGSLLPTFEDRDWPFYKQFLYWPRTADASESEAGVSEDLAGLAVE